MGSRLRQGPLPIDANSWPARIFSRTGTQSVRIPQNTRAGRGSPHSLFQTLDFTLSPLLSSGQTRTRGPGIISLPSLWEVGRAGRALTRHLEPQLAARKATNNPPPGRENSPEQSKWFFFFSPLLGESTSLICSISGIPSPRPHSTLSQGTKGASYRLPVGVRELRLGVGPGSRAKASSEEEGVTQAGALLPSRQTGGWLPSSLPSLLQKGK